MEEKKYNVWELSTAYFIKKSQLYRSGGYRYAKELKRNLRDYSSHFFAFLIDINICLFPVYVWVLEFLLILCGLIPPNFFNLLFYIMFSLLFVTSVLFLGITTARTKGQSVGYYYNGLKLVQQNRKEASALHLILRQALGFGLPIMILGYFFQTAGIAFWWILNGITILVTPNQQSLFDLIFKLKTVREPAQDIKIERSAKPTVQRKIMPVDLHIRSNYSDDGSYDVEEIFKQAKQAKLEVISITDHNCARANSAAIRFARLYDIQYIPGVELDAQYNGKRIRVLGYYVDWDNDVFDLMERESLRREKEVSLKRVRMFEQYSGLRIDTDSLLSNSRFQTITGMDITNMVFNNKQAHDMPLVKQYTDEAPNEKQAKQDFLQAIFGKGGPCFVAVQYPDIHDVIEAIHDADGIAILSSWRLDQFDTAELDTLMNDGIEGIECFSPDISKETIARVLRIVQQRKGFITAGSDYHGPNKPGHYLGVTHCPPKALPLVRILTKAAHR